MRSLRQRVSLPLHSDDPGEIVRHRAESIEHRVELKGPPFPEGLFLCAPGRAHPLGGASPLHARQGEVLAERQPRYREVLWEGSRRQSAGPTNRNRIRGLHAG